VIGQQPSSHPATLLGPDRELAGRQTANEHLVDPRRGRREAPVLQLVVRRAEAGSDVGVPAEDDGLARASERVDIRGSPQKLCVGEDASARRVEVSDEGKLLDANGLADASLALAPPTDGRTPRLRNAVTARNEDRIRLSGDRRAQDAVVEIRDETSELGVSEPRACCNDAVRSHAAPRGETSESPDGHLLQTDHIRLVGGHELDHLPEEGVPLGRHRVAVKDVPRADEQRHRRSLRPVRVVLADPPAFTPPYDHELASALARAGVDVELVTSRFRFGEAPAVDGYVRREAFYPLSSRLFARSRLRLPLKALEHPLGLVALRRRPADIVHVQWLAVPELDLRLFRPQAPAVFTAHDVLPRRTAHKRDLWRALLARFERVVVHSDYGRAELADLGVAATVIPHPVFASDVQRRDDGGTVLSFGVIRAYKGLGDAIEAVRRLGDARLLVAGDPAEPIEPYRTEAVGLDVDWRLGYLSPAEVDRALAEATVAVFPYRPELDQSGALLRALGAGVPAVAYDVGGIAEPVRRFGAGRVVEAGDVEALAAALGDLLSDPIALEQARDGARRARAELTWNAAAAAHLALYDEIA
jgi:glycosyltransferase involved in cell wall biosynthesis